MNSKFQILKFAPAMTSGCNTFFQLRVLKTSNSERKKPSAKTNEKRVAPAPPRVQLVSMRLWRADSNVRLINEGYKRRCY